MSGSQKKKKRAQSTAQYEHRLDGNIGNKNKKAQGPTTEKKNCS